MKTTNPTRSRPSRSSSERSARPRRRALVRAGAVGYASGRGQLASPHDRKQMRDRNAAERARVEEMLANAPLPTDRRRARWTPPITQSAPFSYEQPAERPAARLRALPAQPKGCPVCASAKVTTDEVGRGSSALRLSECLHCDHRWTERPTRRFAEIGGSMGQWIAPARAMTR